MSSPHAFPFALVQSSDGRESVEMSVVPLVTVKDEEETQWPGRRPFPSPTSSSDSLVLGGATNPHWAWRKCPHKESTCKAAPASCCEQGRQMGSEQLAQAILNARLTWGGVRFYLRSFWNVCGC